MAQFLRSYSLIIGNAGSSGIELQGAEIQFRVDKISTSEQNKLNIKIYNLTKSNRANISKRDTIVYLMVGYYGSPLKTIFAGNVVDATIVKQDTDIITELNCADGNINLREARSNRSFTAGATVKDVVTGLVDDLNTVGTEKISIGQLNGDALNDKYQNGLCISGTTKQSLDRVLRGKNLQWSINNLSLQINPKFSANTETAVYLSAKNGMIGVPEFFNVSPDQLNDSFGNGNSFNGIKVKCLLNSNIEPNKKIIIESPPGTQKVYTVQKVTHEGDYRANAWTTTVEATDTF